MRTARCVILSGLLMIAPGLAEARAQEPGLGGILGGYGSMAGGSGSSMGGGLLAGPTGLGGNVIIPAARGLGASMAVGSTGAGLAFRSRPGAAMGAARPSFVLDSMGGPSRAATGMGGRRPFMLPGGPITGGMGLVGDGPRMREARGMGVMPPRIGYPFRQPPSLLAPTALGAGMSM